MMLAANFIITKSLIKDMTKECQERESVKTADDQMSHQHQGLITQKVWLTFLIYCAFCNNKLSITNEKIHFLYVCTIIVCI